ncbi:MOSC domain-containing protein, partial [Acinetobacter baumannii]
FAEDGWKRIEIAGIVFRVVKPCARCVVTTTDQATGRRAPDAEPLRTLATYRRVGQDVLFGQNLVNEGCGRIAVGDA